MRRPEGPPPEKTEGPEEGPDLRGRRVGRYRLERELGSGGMGAVYLARRSDGAFDKPVAVKLAFRAPWDGDLKRRSLDERRILARLEHPNIARLYDGGTVDGYPYFVMEYVDGRPIDVYCREQQLSLSERVELLAKVSDAVGYAHSQLVVHRDVKPQNILVTAAGEPKLLDFGIAKAPDPAQRAGQGPTTAIGSRPLTPSFASPEQLRGEPVTPSSDVYSLGVVLYLLITGTLPRRLDSLAPAAVERCLEREPDPPSRVPAGSGAHPGETGRWPMRLRWQPSRIDRDLDNIVLAALATEARHRFRTAEHLTDDLRRYLAGLPVSSRRSTLAYRAARFVRRHRVGTALGALALFAVADLSVHTVQQTREIARQRDRAIVESERANEVADLLVGILEAIDPSRSPDGARRETALELAAEEVRSRLQGHPLERARLLDTIGRVYLRIGEPRQASELLTEALGLFAREGAPDPRNRTHLGEARIALGEYERAVGHFRAALELHETASPGSSQAFAEAERGLGLALLYSGRISEAETVLTAAVGRLRAEGGEAQGLPEALHALGRVVESRRGSEAAASIYDEAL
ncbi:MAG: protein kinase, partial [Holophagales bacterium]|nr:protein kinase [Holophagales bacterium]